MISGAKVSSQGQTLRYHARKYHFHAWKCHVEMELSCHIFFVNETFLMGKNLSTTSL